MWVILRSDDICATTRPDDLDAIYGPLWARGWPVCLSVIPRCAYRFTPSGPVPDDPADIRDNPDLVAFLAGHLRAGRVELALHGWQHHPGEWASGDAALIRQRVEAGLDVLRSAWPEAAIRVAVPPHDHLSPAGLRALRAAGVGVCSSWAATHGGTRRAHWIGRWRRKRGWDFAPARAGLWPTEVDVLDFAGPDSGDWPRTERLLALAARWDSPVVFVQHPWRLAADDRAERWARWIERVTALPGLRMTGYHASAPNDASAPSPYPLFSGPRRRCQPERVASPLPSGRCPVSPPRARRGEKPASVGPLFSVIITTHNRPRQVARCIQSVLAQTYPAGRVEIIVVDDGSRPRAARALDRWALHPRVRVIHQSQQGWGRARQAGAQHSRGAILAFLDDDCSAPPGWLAHYAAQYDAHPDADGIGGGLRPGPRLTVAGRKQHAGHRVYFQHANAALGTPPDRFGRAWFTFGGNRTFKRGVWLAVQTATTAWYFDDTRIDLALRARGAVVYYDPAAWVTHDYDLGVIQRVRAAYRYGHSEAALRGAEPIPVPAPDSRPPWYAVWSRLIHDAAGATRAGLIWYALTQPLCWVARRWGRMTSRTESR